MSAIPADYADDTTKSRRLAMLRVVNENEGAANQSVIKVALGQLGFRGRFATEELLDADVDMLAGAKLVTIEWYRGVVRTLVITKRGQAFLRREVDPLPAIEYPDF